MSRHTAIIAALAALAFLSLPTSAQDDFVAQARAAKVSGDIDGAVKMLQEGLKGEPDNAEGHYVLAWLYVKQDQNDKAVAAFEKAVELDPDSEQGQEAKAALQRLGASVAGAGLLGSTSPSSLRAVRASAAHCVCG